MLKRLQNVPSFPLHLFPLGAVQEGNVIPADCVICDHSHLLSNESSLTGESDDVKKSKKTDPFLLSACLITECEQTHALVIGIGAFSQWGKIRAGLVNESPPTPLQTKLEAITMQVRRPTAASLSPPSLSRLSPN